MSGLLGTASERPVAAAIWLNASASALVSSTHAGPAAGGAHVDRVARGGGHRRDAGDAGVGREDAAIVRARLSGGGCDRVVIAAAASPHFG
jgi:hypothetical protein